MPTYCLIPRHKLSTVPMKDLLPDPRSSWSEKRIFGTLNSMLTSSSSFLEQAQYGKG